MTPAALVVAGALELVVLAGVAAAAYSIGFRRGRARARDELAPMLSEPPRSESFRDEPTRPG